MLLADESVNKNLIVKMRKSGYDVFSVMEEMAGSNDETIAAFSLNPPRTIISEDKDFGELVYHKNLEVAGVILLRYTPSDYQIIEDKLIHYLNNYYSNLAGKFVVINSKLTRTRFLP